MATLLAAALSIATALAAAATYYVASNGSDTNSGSISQPFATFSHGLGLLNPGDTLYLRSGYYTQAVYAANSGTPASPITIAGCTGESVVIDGAYGIPGGPHDALVNIVASNVIVQDFTVQRSSGMGLVLQGGCDQAIRVASQWNLQNGILVTGLGYSVVTNCQVYYNCVANDHFTNTSWASGLSAARGGFNSVLVNNKVWNNWGEGMSTYQCSNTTMLANKVWDNKCNTYLSDCKYALLAGNLIYATPGNICSNGVSQVGIAYGDETYDPPGSDNTIINNLVLGCYNNFYYWQGANGGGLINVVIANNTFADAVNP